MDRNKPAAKTKNWIYYAVKWSMPLVRAYRKKLVLLFLLMLLSVGMNLIRVNFVQSSIDAVLIRDIGKLLLAFGLFVMVTTLRLAHKYIDTNLYNQVFICMERDLKQQFADKLLRADMAETDRLGSGDLTNKYGSDIPNALQFLKQGFSNYLLNPLMMLGGFFYLFSYHWKLSLSVFLPIPVLAFLLNIMSRKASIVYAKLQGLNSALSEQIYDAVQGAETIKAYQMQRSQLAKIKKILTDIRNENRNYNIKLITVTLALIMAVTYVPMVTVFLYGAWLVAVGEISVSLLFGYSQLIPYVTTPIINLFSSLVSMKNACRSMERLDEVMEMKEERRNSAPNAKKQVETLRQQATIHKKEMVCLGAETVQIQTETFQKPAATINGQKMLWEQADTIQEQNAMVQNEMIQNKKNTIQEITCNTAILIEDVSFGYLPDAPAVEHLELRVSKGQCVGIMGGSGAGKSTIIKLLCGLYEPDKGRIELFGQDIRQTDLDELRSQITYVPQSVLCLSETIAENIRLTNPNVSEEEIWMALKNAELMEEIKALPDGIHTILTEDGDNLSGGQRQRIALARAFSGHSPLFVFDEPTSALDSSTEARIARNIAEKMRKCGSTSILISHSLNALRYCDKIYCLEGGKLREYLF